MREDRWKVERHLVGGKRQRDLRLKRELGSTGCRSCGSQEAATPIEGKQGCWIAVHQNQYPSTPDGHARNQRTKSNRKR